MVSLGNNFKNSSPEYNSIKNNMDKINSKLNDTDKYLPNLNKKIGDAEKNVDGLKIKNKTILDRTQKQGFVKNLFDSEGRAATKEVSSAQKQLDSLNMRKNQAKQNITSDLNSKLDKNKANMKNWEDKIGITDLNSKIGDQQKVFDKATRSTTNARLGTVAGLGAAGFGIKKVRDRSNPIDQQNYFPDLNNNF